MELKAPSIPYVSNETGTWATADAILDPEYWGRQLRGTVRFADGVQMLLGGGDLIFLEVGPGQTLATLSRQQAGDATKQVFIASMPAAQERQSDVVCVLEATGRLWLAGVQPDWAALYRDERRHRVPLPTYPFERQCYWIGPSERPLPPDNAKGASGIARDVAEWFYTPSWKPAALAHDGEPGGTPAHWLIFLDEFGLGSRIAERLIQRGHGVARIVPGDSFSQLDANMYQVCPEERLDYERLIKEIRSRDGRIDRIVHLWSVTADGGRGSDAESFERQQYRGFYSLLFLTQALQKQGVVNSIQLGIVSSHLHVVLGNDTVCPAKATILGVGKVIPQEHTNITTRSIDVAVNHDGLVDERLADHIIAELTGGPFAAVAAYRTDRRWVQTFEALRLEKPAENASHLRPRGVYLITGGLGNIGLALARYLAEAVQARLVLIGRSELPDRARWEAVADERGGDILGQRIRQLLELEALGAEVLVLQADAADRTQMAAAVAAARRRFGEIHGVVHGAGNVSGDGFQPVVQIQQSGVGAQFRPKAEGVMILAELLRDRPPDFVLLLSSLSAVLGGLGLGTYGAANAFLDAFAAQQNQAGGTHWISVNWDAWQFPNTGQVARTGEWAGAIRPAEGADAFGRVLAAAPPQVVVSTSPLQARLDKWVNLEPLRRVGPAPSRSQMKLHPRPNLSSQYVAPRVDVERTIVDIWEQLLGVGPVGIHDKFFELGGHSLLAIQLVARLREAYGFEVPVQRVFEAPTVAELAERISRELAAQVEPEEGDEKLAAALRIVEQLTDEEVSGMLAREGVR
jgi:acyl transferase domain-containing protein/acyl carrier protein